jgi:hypothetical protein
MKSDDDTIPPDSSLAKIARINIEGFKRIGLRTPDGNELRKLLEDAGFVDIEVCRSELSWSANLILVAGAWRETTLGRMAIKS